MYNKILKNYQINVGNPIEVKSPHNTMVNVLKKTMEEQACAIEVEDPEDIIEEARLEAERQAELILSEARYEASRIIETAEEESREKIQQVEEEARHKGYEKGYHEGKFQYETLINEAESIRQKAASDYEEFVKNIESNAVNMVLSIAKKVIDEEVSINKENVLLLIKQAFDKCTNKENCILKISAADYDFVMENQEKLLSMLEGVDNLEIKKDFSLSNGSCIVETPYGTIDASMQTKMRKIEEVFARLLRSSN